VDDQPSNTTLLERVFHRGGGQVISLHSGQEALDFLEREMVDVILLDIMMPQMSGLDVLTALRDNPDTAELPVILISALAEARDIATGLELGANDYITKPFDPKVVRARVSTQLKLKLLMDERNRAIQDLLKANEMKERLMWMASHDLKNPLNNLQLTFQLLQDMVGSDPTLGQVVNVGAESIELMLDIIEQFLDSPVVRGEQLRLNLEPVEVRQVLQRVVHQYEAAAEHKRITLKVTNDEGTLIADERRLVQILANLVSNAIKYSPQDTTVTIKSDMNEKTGRIHVLDEGPGVPPDERSLLFQPFSRLTPRPTAGESSTGLGLWSVQQLMILQQGRAGADFPETGGSDFWIELPIASS
jgi:signal transduction histidine kinase